MASYMRPLTELVVKYIENEGIEVIDSIAFEIPDNLEVGLRDPLQLIDDVRRLNTKGADVVVASACVQMPSLAAIPHIEDMLGIRTVSTAVCTTRSMLDRLGLEPIVPAAGALLAGSTTTDRTSEDAASRVLSLSADGFGPRNTSSLLSTP